MNFTAKQGGPTNNSVFEMEKEEIRCVIKYFYLKGFRATDIKVELDSTLGTFSLSSSTIHRWMSDFRLGRTSTRDGARAGRPRTV